MIATDARGAWHELEAQLRPFVARRVASPVDVDDVVQDVFLRMHRGLAGMREDDRFGPWVYRVARSAIADHRRARARHPLAHAEPPDAPALADDEECDGVGPVEQRLAAYVAPFISLLPSPYREALTLTELEGVSQKDAAAMLGVSVSAMKSRVQRGRVHLRELFEMCCEIALDARGRVIACEPRAQRPAASREACDSCEPSAQRAGHDGCGPARDCASPDEARGTDTRSREQH